jgi:hypothetical protein
MIDEVHTWEKRKVRHRQLLQSIPRHGPLTSAVWIKDHLGTLWLKAVVQKELSRTSLFEYLTIPKDLQGCGSNHVTRFQGSLHKGPSSGASNGRNQDF